MFLGGALWRRVKGCVTGCVVGCVVGCLTGCGAGNGGVGGGEPLWLFVGSYAGEDEEGVKVYEFDQASGEARYVSGVKGVANPSYLCVCPREGGAMVYAVGEGGEGNSSMNAIAFDASDAGLEVSDRVLTRGASPCYINRSEDGRWVVTANYMGANVSVVRVDSAGRFAGDVATYGFEGRGVVEGRQEQPHPHCVEWTPDGRRLLACDLGLDCVHVFDVDRGAADASGYLRHTGDLLLEAGSGPRHIVYGKDGGTAYVINEISGRVAVIGVRGDMAVRQYVASDTVGAQGSGDIHVSGDGRFVYSSNRLEADGVAVFGVEEDGRLRRVGYQATGRHPRNFVLTPNGRFVLVACRDDNVIEVYERDAETGMLSETGRRIETGRPVCMKFMWR